MYINYEWVKQYLENAPSLEEAARLLNQTGLETEIENGGLEIEHTVNRPDAMSHFGVARELAVKLGGGLIVPPVYEGAIEKLEGWRVDSCDPAECPRYIALLIHNLKAEPSPPWLVERLESIDQTCHNFLVDITNFLLWEFGHPSHAFDGGMVAGKHLIIRFGEKGETLTTLDGNDHDAEGLLCIADEEKPVAFAGVMGGQNSEVRDDTTEVLLELASFKPVRVRRTGASCNINSDARHRFERGIDREKMERVIRRFIFLLKQQQPQAEVVGQHDMDLTPFERPQVFLRRSYLDKLLGIHLPDQQVTDLLVTMDCDVEHRPEGWSVSIPGYKVDVVREVDLVEEVIRFAGLDLLVTDLPEFRGADLKPDPIRDSTNAIRMTLQGLGLQEAYTYSFMPQEWDTRFVPSGEPIRLRNPMTLKQAVMRRRLLPGLLDAVLGNLKRGIGEIAFFETGHTFNEGREPHHLAVVIADTNEQNHWWNPSLAHPFYQIKGVFEALVTRLGWNMLELRDEAPGYLNPAESLGVYFKDVCVGGFGSLAHSIMQSGKSFKFDSAPAILELDLEFVAQLSNGWSHAEELPKHPGMKMDLAFVLDKSHPYDAIRNHILELALPDMETLELFDHFEGKSIGPGKKSLGFRFRFQARDRTLTSEEVNRSMDRVVISVREAFGGEIRM